MEKTEDIRKKCIEANDEIVELKFGCRVKIPANRFYDWVFVEELQRSYDKYVFTASKGDGRSNASQHINRDCFEIIGRPIRLADILLAIGFDYNNWNGDNCSNVFELLMKWNPKDNNLENQSQPTIDFIHRLLYDK